MKLRENLQALLADGKTKQLIAQLRIRSANDPELLAEVLQLSAQFAELERQTRLNTVDPKLLGMERNRIHGALLLVIERLADDNPPVVGWFSSWQRIAVALTSVIIIGTAVAKFYQNNLHGRILETSEAVSTEKPALKSSDQPLGSDTGAAEIRHLQEENKTKSSASISSKTNSEKPNVTVPLDTVLSVACKTDKGVGQLHYRSGEDMRLFVLATQPCYLRIIYQLADGRLTLLVDGRRITSSETGRYIQAGPDLTCDAPFGEETLYVFAQSLPFPALETVADPDGYTHITDGLPDALRKTRGFKTKNRFAEATLNITTFEK